MINLNAETFSAFIDGHPLALVDFHAPWCAACPAFASVLESLEDEAGTAVFAGVDVNAEPETADRYGITGLPSVIIFRFGEPVFKETGALSKQAVRRALKDAGAYENE